MNPALSADLALAANSIQRLFQSTDTAPDRPTVDFELCLSGASGPNTTRCSAVTGLLTREVSPLAGETGKKVVQLCKFPLGLGFSRPCPFGEDVQDQSTSVDDLDTRQILQCPGQTC